MSIYQVTGQLIWFWDEMFGVKQYTKLNVC